VVHRALRAACEAWAGGERGAAALVAIARRVLAECPDLRVEYLEVVEPDGIRSVDDADDRSVMAIAAWLGPVRLIDNVTLAGRDDPAASERTSTGAPCAAVN